MADDLEFETLGENYSPPDPGVPGPSSQRVQEQEETPIVETSETENNQNTTLAKTLEALNDKINRDTTNAQLIADPQIRELLAMKAQGKKIRLVGDDEVRQNQERKEVEIVPPNLETMTNAELTKYMTDSLAKTFQSSISQIVSTEVGKLRGELKPSTDAALLYAQNQQAQAVQNQIATVRDKYKDFDQMKPKMIEINKTVQGASVEELYLLAKVRSGLPIVTQKEIETERPNSAPGQRQAFKRPEVTRGRKGFSDLVGAALDSAIPESRS